MKLFKRFIYINIFNLINKLQIKNLNISKYIFIVNKLK